MADTTYTLVLNDDEKDQPTAQELKTQLEKGRDEEKIETMKKILVLMLNGDPMTSLLMHVIRFVMPSKNKVLKKLLLFYLEICPRLGPDGKLKAEMRLLCHALRNDLQHPNEYVRGNTLRFMCKIREDELLEPCIPAIRSCLEHRHSYVRKNAVLAVHAAFKNFEYLIPDGPDLIFNYLQNESDANAKRNAFVMLINTKPILAAEYLGSIADTIQNMDEVLQLAAIEFVRKDFRNAQSEKGMYTKCIFALLQSSAHTVKYEAANTLVALTSNSTAIKAAASCYIELILKESDNNIKLIVLDRIDEIREKHDRVLDDLVMDILRVLARHVFPDIDVRRKVLRIAMQLCSARNIDEVVAFLKKELLKTNDQDYEKNNEYRQLLINSIHSCAIKFSEVASNVVHVLMEFIGDSNNASAVDVIAFVREVMEKFPKLRPGIMEKLLESFGELKTNRVFRGALWIIGEYTLEARAIELALKKIKESLGEIPILASEQRLLEGDDEGKTEEEGADAAKPKPATAQRRVLADGTYATESALSSVGTAKLDAVKAAAKPPLRALILSGDYYVSSALASALTKLVLRFSELSTVPTKVNEFKCEAMLILTSIIRVGKSEFPTSQIDEDTYDRISNCLKILSGIIPEELNLRQVFLKDTRKAFTQLTAANDKKIAEQKTKNKKVVKVQADDLLVFRQLKSKKGGADLVDEYEMDINKATGQNEKGDDFVSKLSKVVQLTGFSDPVYAEAYVNVHQYDILLDILIVNQTSETMQNLTVEFSTLGDLKLVERPTPYTIGPRGFHSIRANIKVSSTETGVIFGNIVYDGPSVVDVNCVIMNDIHIDIMDYIKPATCSEAQFRSMWNEFEWENKVNVNTNITDLKSYLNHVMKYTNMSCLTPDHALSGDCGFLAANLYARSIFGEDALANICLEKQGSSISGHIRIRSKTQGIALSLGDKVLIMRKGFTF
ncbi:coatomer subunit beta [Phlyctochytrium planicorne]|nr:coatomer subunit beta [Phlyctochytrium planicorne]